MESLQTYVKSCLNDNKILQKHIDKITSNNQKKHYDPLSKFVINLIETYDKVCEYFTEKNIKFDKETLLNWMLADDNLSEKQSEKYYDLWRKYTSRNNGKYQMAYYENNKTKVQDYQKRKYAKSIGVKEENIEEYLNICDDMADIREEKKKIRNSDIDATTKADRLDDIQKKYTTLKKRRNKLRE